MSLLIFSPPALAERFHEVHSTSEAEALEPAGYPLLDRAAYEKKYLCSKCELLLREPVQNIDCGHRFCLGCYQRMVRKGSLTCPVCWKERSHLGNPKNLGQCFRDNATKREVLNLIISCANKGCEWTGPLKELEEKHRHSCPGETIDCPYKTLGCKQQVRRKDVEEHEEKMQVFHQRLLHEALQSSAALSQSAASSLKDLKERLESLESAVGGSGGELIAEKPSADCTWEKKLAEVEAKQNTLQNIVAVLSREMGRREFPSLPAKEHQLSPSVEARITLLEEKVAQQDSLLVLKDMMLQGLASHLQVLQQATYDGTFLWKIDDVQRKMKEARTGKRTALYSPAFFTGRYGYKLCLKVFLNGDGAGFGTHLSLFLVLMKGEYDFQLVWPFMHKVVFLLLDQSNLQHVSTSFRPSAGTSSFQRPKHAMNVASGIPEFVPLDLLRTNASSFLQDNTMVIKAVVETSS
ncbi:TNF receptor-associated factor 1-like [Ambystoma mexicanum]|uniref:TNF receptor-associated factor 1-like n=1 Tax=Ambystoma mexicanum TaxID=8296 RepID=UPI0037E8BE38